MYFVDLIQTKTTLEKTRLVPVHEFLVGSATVSVAQLYNLLMSNSVQVCVLVELACYDEMDRFRGRKTQRGKFPTANRVWTTVC